MDVKITTYEDCPDSLSFTAILERVRITIEASVRKKLKIRYSSLISIIVKSLKIKTEK